MTAISFILGTHPAGIDLFKISNGNITVICGIHSKLKIKTPEWGHRRGSSVFIVNVEQISHIVLVLSLFILNKKMLTAQYLPVYTNLPDKTSSTLSFTTYETQKSNRGENKIDPTEAATRGVLWKNVFLEISQNSQETPVPKSLF